MAPIARMQDGGEPAARGEGDVDRKIADYDLPSHRTQKPLSGEQNRFVINLTRNLGIVGFLRVDRAESSGEG